MEEKIKELIKYLKTQLKNHMLVKQALTKYEKTGKGLNEFEELRKTHPFSFGGNEQITIIHIIYNRLRRGKVRPHLENFDKENEMLCSYEMTKIENILKKEGFDEDVYNVE